MPLLLHGLLHLLKSPKKKRKALKFLKPKHINMITIKMRKRGHAKGWGWRYKSKPSKKQINKNISKTQTQTHEKGGVEKGKFEARNKKKAKKRRVGFKQALHTKAKSKTHHRSQNQKHFTNQTLLHLVILVVGITNFRKTLVSFFWNQCFKYVITSKVHMKLCIQSRQKNFGPFYELSYVLAVSVGASFCYIKLHKSIWRLKIVTNYDFHFYNFNLWKSLCYRYEKCMINFSERLQVRNCIFFLQNLKTVILQDLACFLQDKRPALACYRIWQEILHESCKILQYNRWSSSRGTRSNKCDTTKLWKAMKIDTFTAKHILIHSKSYQDRFMLLKSDILLSTYQHHEV